MDRLDPATLGPSVTRRLIESSADLFAAIADDGRITWMNTRSRELLGREPDDMVGKNILDLLHPDDHALAIDAVESRGARERMLIALRVGHADGTWVSLEFGGADLREHDGSGVFMVWGRPDNPSNRLLLFLRSLLERSDLDHLLTRITLWQDSAAPNSRTVLLVPEGDHRFVAAGTSSDIPKGLGSGLEVDIDDPGPWSEAAKSGEPVAWDDLDGLGRELRSMADEAGFTSVWAYPVLDGPLPPAAMVVVWRRVPGTMRAPHIRQLEGVDAVVKVALRWAADQHTLVKAATTDPLTGLVNRTELDQTIRRDRSPLSALLFCDVDDFKVVNDHHGHLVGDAVLKELASRMQTAVRGRDLVARLGGDEFGIWCPDIESGTDALAVAERLMASTDLPIEAGGHEHRLGLSIGIALLDQTSGRPHDLESALTAADTALYEAKRSGKGRFLLA